MSKTGRLLGDYLVNAFQTAEIRYEEARFHQQAVETEGDPLDQLQADQIRLQALLADQQEQLSRLRQALLLQQQTAMNRLLEAQQALETLVQPQRIQLERLGIENHELRDRLERAQMEMVALQTEIVSLRLRNQEQATEIERLQKHKPVTMKDSGVECSATLLNARILYLERERERLEHLLTLK